MSFGSAFCLCSWIPMSCFQRWVWKWTLKLRHLTLLDIVNISCSWMDRLASSKNLYSVWCHHLIIWICGLNLLGHLYPGIKSPCRDCWLLLLQALSCPWLVDDIPVPPSQAFSIFKICLWCWAPSCLESDFVNLFQMKALGIKHVTEPELLIWDRAFYWVEYFPQLKNLHKAPFMCLFLRL